MLAFLIFFFYTMFKEDSMKKVKIIEEQCIFCGQCEAIIPEVFKITDKAEILLEEIPEGLEERVQEAIDACPTDAIVWGEETTS